MGCLEEEKKESFVPPMLYVSLLPVVFPVSKPTGEQLPCYTKNENKMSLWKARIDGSYIITYHIYNDSYYNFVFILLLFQ